MKKKTILLIVLLINVILIFVLTGCLIPYTSRFTQIVRLTSNTSMDTEPTWSPDGGTIVFISNRINPSKNKRALFAINPNGTNERELAYITLTYSGGGFYCPSWLGTTGDLLVLETKDYWEFFRFQLSKVTSFPVARNVWDGNSPYFTRLLFVPGGQAAFSPITTRDGSKFAWVDRPYQNYLSPEQIADEVRVFKGSLNSSIGDTDSSGNVVFKTDLGGNIFRTGIAFSPDGKKIVVSACVKGFTEGKGHDLYVVNLATKGVKRLTTTGEGGGNNINPSWSSKNVIAFAFAVKGGEYDLYEIQPDGSGLTRLTNTSWNEICPSWSPNGDEIAFASDKEGNYDIYVMK